LAIKMKAGAALVCAHPGSVSPPLSHQSGYKQSHSRPEATAESRYYYKPQEHVPKAAAGNAGTASFEVARREIHLGQIGISETQLIP
jgi:hypothetical protein